MYEYDKSTYDMTLAPFVPVVTGLRHGVGNGHGVDKVVWAFEHRPDKAGRQMPRDVAVEGPDTRVVLVPFQDDV